MINIFKNFFKDYYYLFVLLIFVIIFEGLVNLLATFSVIPFTEFILNPELSNASKVTTTVVNIFNKMNFQISYWSLGLIFIVLNFIKVINFALIRYLILKIKYFITHKIYEDLVKTFLEFDWVFFSQVDRGKFINSFTKEMDVIGHTIGNIASQVANLLQLLLYLSVPLYINFKLTIMILSCIAIFVLPFLYLSKFSYYFGKKNLHSSNELMHVINDIVQGAKTIISHEKQSFVLEDFKHKYKNHIYFTIKSQITNHVLPQFFMPCAIFSIIVSVGYLSEKELNFSELSGVLWSLISIIPIFLSFLRNKAGLSSFVPSYEQLSKLKKDAIDRKRIDGKKIFKSFSSKISFSNVKFKYDNKDIIDISTNIEKNKITTIVGKSGSGKSTLLDIILKIIYPYSGKITIDDVDFSDISGSSLRNKIGFVAQDNFLFSTTIKNNLLWARPNATSEDIDNALKKSFSYEFVNKLPNKLNTQVGDRGGMLSGGERQRIAIARALIRRPDILIFDEATSALDNISENNIIKSIVEIAKETTVILSTHKLPLIKYSDKIIIIEGGKIIEEGQYNNLISIENSVLNKMINSKVIGS